MNEPRSISHPLIAIFAGASELPPGEERRKYLDEACGGDPALRAEVEQLLSAEEEGAAYMKTDAAASAVNDATVVCAAQEKAGETIGTYKLLEPVGEGGFGTVWVAEQQRPLRRRVALKILKPGMDSRQVLARFEAERQALAIMDHPNIATVHDGGVSVSGRPFFVMELVKGVPITEFCDQQHLPPRERLDLFLQVFHAVQHAHQKGIIHRDLKPSNILVAMHDTRPVVKVIDFGIAKALGQELTDQTLFTGLAQMIGTPLYMSPEQAGQSSLDVDTRSDIYSLGVLLYELLTGATPFARERFKEGAYDEIRRIIREEEPPKPSTRLSESKDSLPSISALRDTAPDRLTKLVRGELDWIVMKALEKDRSRRYETGNGFALDVQRYLANEPVLACPPSAGYRLRKFARRNKGPMAAAAIILLTLVAGIIGTTLGWVRAEHAWRAAAEQADAERAAKELAKMREAETRAIAGFFESQVLRAAQPSGDPGGLGRNVTLREALEAAMPSVDEAFLGKPYVKLRIRKQLGFSFRALGEPAIGAAQAGKALAIGREHLGPTHPDTLESMRCLAYCYADLGRLEEALGLREEVLRSARSNAGLPDLMIVNSMTDLAGSYCDAGRAEDGVKLDEEALSFAKTRLGPDHPATLNTMNSLAASYDWAGRQADSLRLRKEVLERQIATLGQNDSQTIGAMNNLGASYRTAGHYAEALILFEKVLTSEKARLGPGHLRTIGAMGNVAMAYLDLGRREESLELHSEALALATTHLGPDHPTTLIIMNAVAMCRAALGQHGEAVRLWEETLELRKRVLGPDHPDTQGSMENLSSGYLATDRASEALALREEALKLRTTKLGPLHPDTLWSMHNLANALAAAGQNADALRLRKETLALAREVLGDTYLQTLWCMNNVALGYAEAGQLAEACRLHEETVACAGKTFGDSHPETLRFMGNLAIAYDAHGRGEEARELRARIESRGAAVSPSQPRHSGEAPAKTTPAIPPASVTE